MPHCITIAGGLLWLMAAQPALAVNDTAPPSLAPSDAKRSQAELTSLLTLQASVEIALERNPGLAGARAKAEALETIAPQEGALPDPRLGLNALNLPTDTFALDQEPMTQLQLFLSQSVPLPSKLALRRGAAEQEAAAAAAQVEEQTLALVAQVRTGWWQLFYLVRALETVARKQQLMRQLIEIARTKYQVGQGLQQDVLLAQLELSRLLDRELQLRNAHERSRATLNALFDRPANSPIRLPRQPPSAALPPLAAEDALLRLAEQHRPSLGSERRLLNAAKSRLSLAKQDYYPEFTVSVGYGFRQGNDPVRSEPRSDLLSLGLSVNVPLYFAAKQSKQVDQRTGELFEHKATLQAARRSVQAAVSQHYADYQRASEQVTLFQTGIIPQARQTVASMLAGYQVAKVDFLNLVNAEITLYNYEINYWQALSEAKQALAQLTAAVGVETIHD